MLYDVLECRLSASTLLHPLCMSNPEQTIPYHWDNSKESQMKKTRLPGKKHPLLVFSIRFGFDFMCFRGLKHNTSCKVPVILYYWDKAHISWFHVNDRERDGALYQGARLCPARWPAQMSKTCSDRLVPDGLSVFSVTRFSFNKVVLITLLHSMI